jgi:2-amino-4-hydroxy-6-hydroxymethyldihydropteridine diphosphokinase
MSHNSLTAFIGYGGNLGDPVATLRRALPMIEEAVGPVVKLSSLYETKALTLGGEVHPNYINAVIEVSTTQEPEIILKELLRVERELGRDRSPDKRWEPRTIDLDLLFVGSMVLSTPDLKLPHPELIKRDFVVEPLAEIAGDFTHPLLVKTMRELKIELAASDNEPFVLRTFPSEI